MDTDSAFLRSLALAALIITASVSAAAQNPISPMGTYIADPSARVAPDGRLYIYGSLDVVPGAYCSDTYHVLSTGNAVDWTLHRDVFKWNTTLYAPDAAFRGGKCYLYFDVPDGSEYVAVGDSPTGPFRDERKIENLKEIDPAVFTDDDGQDYYFYGQFNSKGMKMNPDLCTVDYASEQRNMADEEHHGFHEGSFMFKRGEHYYLVYADISRNHRPTCIGYSMGPTPFGPFTYKGVIVDNAGCDPEVWNNHGSVVEFKGKWYVLYHRATHGCISMRKACIEPIEFNEDGTINEVEMTSQGAAGPLDAFKTVDAGRVCLRSGHSRIMGCEGMPEREILGQIRNGDTAVWKYLDFGKGAAWASLLLKSTTGGCITMYADEIGGKPVGIFKVKPSEDWQEVKARIRKTKGVHALWLKFEADPAPVDAEGADADVDIFSLDSVRFGKSRHFRVED